MKIDKILVPVDFSQNSLAALPVAKELASRFEAEILLLHVVEPPVYPASMGFGAGAISLPAIYEEIRENVSEHLRRLREEEVHGAKTLLRDGNPSSEILAAAAEESADLIVIATHGHTGIKHMLLGSTAEKVVRAAPCPVLTVRSPG